MLDDGICFEIAAYPDLDIAAEQSPYLGLDLVRGRTLCRSSPRKREQARRLGRCRAGATRQRVASDASKHGKEQP
jgi:hypothetical protein